LNLPDVVDIKELFLSISRYSETLRLCEFFITLDHIKQYNR